MSEKPREEYLRVSHVVLPWEKEPVPMVSLSDYQALKARLVVAVDRLKEFADYDNPNELKYISSPTDSFMRRARETLDDILGRYSDILGRTSGSSIERD